MHRIASPLRLLFLSVLIGGCTTPESPQEDDGVPRVDPDRSTWSSIEWTVPVTASTMEPAIKEIEVKEGVMDVSMGLWDDAAAFTSLRATLQDCGAYDVGGSSVGSGSRFEPKPTCEDLTPGTKQLRVEVDGFFHGSITIKALQPN